MRMRFCLMTLVLCLSPTALAQTTNDIRPLGLGQPVEHEITGGTTHTYQIQLAVGQFLRFRLEQRAIDGALILNTPDGKKSIEMDLTGAGEEEQLSLEVTLAGIYQLIVRGNGAATMRKLSVGGGYATNRHCARSEKPHRASLVARGTRFR